MANYKVPRVRRDRGRAPAQRHGQGDEGIAARDGPPRAVPRERDRRAGALVPGRAARRRDGCVGSRTVGRRRSWPTGAPTSSRWSPRPATPCDACSARSASVARTSPTRRSRRTTAASAASCSTCATKSPAANLEQLLDTADVFLTQPASRCARRSRPGARGDRRTASAPRLLQRQRLRAARRGPEPADLRHRGVLGPVRSVGPALRQRGGPAQRTRRHRRPHQRARRVGRRPRRGARATPDGPGPRRRGVAAANGELRARVGTSACRPISARWRRREPRHSNQTPLMNSVPDQGRPLALLHRARGGPPHRGHPAAPWAARTCWPTRASPTRRAIRKNRVEVIATLDEIIAERLARGLGRAARPRRRVVGARPGPAEVLADPQLLANDGVVELGDEADGTRQRSINGPVSFSDVRVRPSTPAPKLGEHTDAVLAEVARLADERTGSAP